MSVVGWFEIGVVATVYLWLWRCAAARVAWAEAQGEVPDADDIVWGIAVGIVYAPLVPFVAAAEYLKRSRGASLHGFVTQRVLRAPGKYR